MAAAVIGLHDIQLAEPLWLWLWPLSVLVLGLSLRYGYLHHLGDSLRRLVRARYRHPALALLRRLYRPIERPTSRRFVWQWLAYSLVALGIHGALAQPFYHGTRLPDPPQYRDAVFVIDSSISMVLKDYVIDGQRVDRLTMMKHVMSHLVDHLEGNRIGVISFSEQAYTLVPLTDDYPVLLSQIQRLRPASLTGRSSRPGDALLYTAHTLGQQLGEDAPKPVLVMISDVNRPDRRVDPRVAAEYLADLGYRLHVIGIGGASYSAGDDSQRGLIYHPSNFALLESMAARGNGKFYWAKSTQSLQAAISTIQDSERHTVDTTPRFVPVTLYHWPLLFALLILALFSLPDYRRRSH